MKLRAAILTVDPEGKVTESPPDRMYELTDRKTGATEELEYDELLLVPPFQWKGDAIVVTVSLCATDNQGQKHVHPVYRNFPLTLHKKIYPERWSEWSNRLPMQDEILQLLQDSNLLAAEAGNRWNISLETKLIDNAGATISDFASNRTRREVGEEVEKP